MFRRVELGLQHAFADHGRRTATRPCGTALVTVLVFVGLGFGVFNVKVETDVLKLWVDDSTSLTDVRDDSWTAVSPRSRTHPRSRKECSLFSHRGSS